MTDVVSPAELVEQLGLPPCQWQFPPPHKADRSGLVVVGGDLSPSTLITAYCSGLFPMPVGRKHRLGWWSPQPRAILPPDELQISRSLRRSVRRFETRVNSAFRETMLRCGDPRRPHGWITPEFIDAFCVLNELGIAHSVETWTEDGRLVGGLYGVSIHGLFAGESMFHSETDASKVALVALCGVLQDARNPDVLLDTQWLTPHLVSLGAREIHREDYLTRLGRAIRPGISMGPLIDGPLVPRSTTNAAASDSSPQSDTPSQ